MSNKEINPFPAVKTRWWLCNTSDMSQITQLSTMHNKQLQLMLNQGGTFGGYLHLEDKKTVYLEEHKTCILYYRNGEAKWSGPIFKCVDDTNSLSTTITANGWFELLNKRMVHTGLEWKEMAIKASGEEVYRGGEHLELGGGIIIKPPTEIEGIEIQYEQVLESGFYVPPVGSTESAQEIYYANVPMAEIANDLIIRANIDVPTHITVGEVAPTNSINYTINQFANVGEQITKLTAIESGFDFEIDPLTRKFNTYRNEIKGGIAGLGVDRGPGVKFTYPGNCLSANRSRDGFKTQNRTEVTGQFGIGKAESIQSINENGLFEINDSLPEVTVTNILIAYANSETDTLEQPFQIVTFEPRSVNNPESISVPRIFDDYKIGDIVYTVVVKGPRLRIGLKTPQPVRVFGFTLNDEDNGNEKISGIQTVYSQ